jgi:iron complex transport system substrate-binding protein
MPVPKTGYLICIAFLMAWCRPEKYDRAQSPHPLNNTVHDAKRFGIVKIEGGHYLFVFGDRNRPADTTARFILSEDTLHMNKKYPLHHLIKTPCGRIAALSSIYASMFSQLGDIRKLVAIDNIDYVNDTAVMKRFRDPGLRELSKGPEMDEEQTIALHPDIVFSFGMGYASRQKENRISKMGIPLFVSVDHLEESSLARAEWIKAFAVFTGKLEKADSIFREVKNKYEGLKNIAAKATGKLTVFSEVKFGDVWYMPGGRSFMSTLLKDAGAEYLWANNDDFGSLPLSFEQVYAKARNADVWINLPLVNSKKELLEHDARYKKFKPFATDKIYNNTLHKNIKGYSDYWETGMYHPERILHDLVLIFHPELASEIGNEFYYYERLR